MPWYKKTKGNQTCVVDKTGKELHCYNDEKEADKYIAVLYANAGPEAHKMLENMIENDLDSSLSVRKQGEGYWITAVSTAAMADREGETFETGCIDYDLKEAKRLGDYPKFTLFHKGVLKFGKVEKMSRVGIFAVDEGPSDTDPFSLAVCEKMLSNNDSGKWRISRGFRVSEASGYCPKCKEGLVIETKHMVAGFKCPHCDAVHMSYKGVLSDVHFRKVRTFEDTVTDHPAVPWTGVSASKIYPEENIMTKSELKKILKEAGLSDDAIDARLKTVSDDRLKELQELPEAEVLKELDVETEEKEEPEEEEPVEEDQTFVLDPEVLKDFTEIVKQTVHEEVAAALDGLSIDLEGVDVSMKEVPGLVELKEQVDALVEAVTKLLEKDESRLKEILRDSPRAAKLRIVRHKAKVAADDEEDLTDQGDDEDAEGEMPKKFSKKVTKEDGSFIGADGKNYGSATNFMLGKAE